MKISSRMDRLRNSTASLTKTVNSTIIVELFKGLVGQLLMDECVAITSRIHGRSTPDAGVRLHRGFYGPKLSNVRRR